MSPDTLTYLKASETGVPPDVWRYYLLKARPETGDTQFEWKSLIEQNNGELLAKLGNFVNRVIKLVNSKIYDSTIPDYTKMLKVEPFSKAVEEVNAILKQYNEEMESVSLRAGLASAMTIAQAGNNFLQVIYIVLCILPVLKFPRSIISTTSLQPMNPRKLPQSPA